MSRNEILIDRAGWGDLILGVVIGALKLPEHMYMERRVPYSSFQSLDFKNKRYLVDAVRIVEEVIDVMGASGETCFKIAHSLSGDILFDLYRYLRDKGFCVEKVENTGELQTRVEKSYVEWCIEAGVPVERLKRENRFWELLEWVSEEPEVREKLVKTGWRSWQQNMVSHDTLMEVAGILGGKEAAKIAEVLSHVYETTDMEIVAKSSVILKTVRKILYRFYDHSLVALRRTRDKHTGWFTFHWKLQPEQIYGFLTNQKKHILEKLEVRLNYEKNHTFYSCYTLHCRRLSFEEAIEYVFRCPKCNKPLTHFDNRKVIKFLFKKTKQLKNELNE